MKQVSQKQMAHMWLKEQGTIRARDAIESFDCLRLASCICDLRKQGYTILTEEVGNSGYAKYYLKEDKEVIHE
jgi:hypothetical protein